ncbi:MAG: DnaJ domain-containing protein [Armatimonadetes bacterium]|nr:DnaJ domain-containing protein [Armatimonadota bacterium]
MNVDWSLRVLSLERGCTEEEAKSAFRREALKWHPDKYASADSAVKDDALEQMQRVNQAYDLLQDYEPWTWANWGVAASGHEFDETDSHREDYKEETHASYDDVEEEAPQSEDEDVFAASQVDEATDRQWTSDQPVVSKSWFGMIPVSVKAFVCTIGVIFIGVAVANREGSAPVASFGSDSSYGRDSSRNFSGFLPDSTSETLNANRSPGSSGSFRETPPPFKIPTSQPDDTDLPESRSQEIYEATSSDESSAVSTKGNAASQKQRNDVEVAEPEIPRNVPSGYFTLGSTEDDVLAVQGTPSRITRSGNRKTFHYGASEVKFQDGRVVDYENYGRLKIKIG